MWDFPPGLYKRELAAYLFSEALGWGLVPPTIVREGPLGEGSFQLFTEAEFEQHWFTPLAARVTTDAWRSRLHRPVREQLTPAKIAESA